MAVGGGGWDTTGFTYSSSACTCYPPYCRCREPKSEPVKCPDCGTWFQNEHRCPSPWKYQREPGTSTSVDTGWQRDYVLWNGLPNT